MGDLEMGKNIYSTTITLCSKQVVLNSEKKDTSVVVSNKYF